MWSDKAWDARRIYGATRYHFWLSPLQPDDILVVKVADRRENGKYIYESINPTIAKREALDGMSDFVCLHLEELYYRKDSDERWRYF